MSKALAQNPINFLILSFYRKTIDFLAAPNTSAYRAQRKNRCKLPRTNSY
ncbi:hypothetical protein O59_004202 [Cellvibrio sp. BR]|nr:hypothetical protein O59_004202 [Cellvibrio sp. BR]